MENQTP